MASRPLTPIRKITAGAPIPEPAVVTAELAAQHEERYIILENTAIDSAFGVWDDEFDQWVATPFYSRADAEELLRRAKAR